MFSIQPESYTTSTIFRLKKEKQFLFVHKEVNQIKNKKFYSENKILEPLGKRPFAKWPYWMFLPEDTLH